MSAALWIQASAAAGAGPAPPSGADLLQLIFAAGSVLFLLAIFLVLKSPIDLSDDTRAPPADRVEALDGPPPPTPHGGDEAPPDSAPERRRAS